MNEALETIMEVREDFMVSPAGDSGPTLRTAHFLKPLAHRVTGSASASHDHEIIVPASTTVSLRRPIFEPKESPLSIHFSGWRHSRKWTTWLDTLHPKYESVWKKVGIFEAIMGTKSCIIKDQNLALGVAEKWCSETKTFVFPWGEATVTLEDVMVLGGYPVLGDPVFTALGSREMKEREKKLVQARKVPGRSKHRKPSTSAWMDLFINNSGSDIEHEAFLVAWLSMFVFPSNNDLVKTTVFPIAIHLARGNRIALAPAVLAGVYKDLGFLKRTLVCLTQSAFVGDEVMEVTLLSPFYLVQVWVWERFKNLQPQPKLINKCDPVLYRWHKVKALKADDVRLALDSAVEHFLWRPYVRHAGWCRLFYAENEICAPLDPNLDSELVSSLVRCWRVSELVGLGCFIEQYLPHRVAMQFGFDQDVPGSVARFNYTEDIAWENYCRPISDGNLYFPPRLFEADVTTQYAWWWKQSVLGHEEPVKNIVRQKRSERPSKAKKSGDDADVPPGSAPKLVSAAISGKTCDRGSKTGEGDYDTDVPPGFLPKRLKTVASGNCVQYGLKANQCVDANVPTGFPPNFITLNPYDSVEDCEPVLEEIRCGDMTHNLGKVATDECMHLPNQRSSSSAADYEAAKRILPQAEQVAEDNIEPSIEALVENFEYVSGSKESSMSSDRVSVARTQGGGNSRASEVNIVELEERIKRLERVFTKIKLARFGQN